jgi:hypothetical protein
MGEAQAVANIIYSTATNPVDLNGDVDVEFARENEVRFFPTSETRKVQPRRFGRGGS